MTLPIYLTKNGLCIRKKKEFLPIDQPFSYYLNEYPKIDKGFTVGDLMQILKQNENAVDLIFMSHTKGFSLSPYYQEMELASLKQDKSKITTIEFGWRTDISNTKEVGKPKYELSEYVNIIGRIDNEKTNYSLSFVSLNELKDAVIKLDKNIHYNHYDLGDLWDENRKTVEKTFFKGIRNFTLQDIIGAFLNEITFYGYPEQADEVASDLEKTSKNYKNQKTFRIEELQLEMAKKSFDSIQKKKQTKKNILRLEKLSKEITYLEKIVTEIKNPKK